MGNNIFVYGTLLFESVMHAVTGRDLTYEPAHLEGYACYSLKRRNYPGMIRQVNSVVYGGVYKDLDAESLRRLDYFEGDEYIKQAVYPKMQSGQNLPAQTYIIHLEKEVLLLKHKPWSKDEFELDHLLPYQQHVTEIMQSYCL